MTNTKFPPRVWVYRPYGEDNLFISEGPKYLFKEFISVVEHASIVAEKEKKVGDLRVQACEYRKEIELLRVINKNLKRALINTKKRGIK